MSCVNIQPIIQWHTNLIKFIGNSAQCPTVTSKLHLKFMTTSRTLLSHIQWELDANYQVLCCLYTPCDLSTRQYTVFPPAPAPPPFPPSPSPWLICRLLSPTSLYSSHLLFWCFLPLKQPVPLIGKKVSETKNISKVCCVCI